MKPEITNNRRLFINKSGLCVTRVLFVARGLANAFVFLVSPIKIPISKHLRVYASTFLPKWDCMPVLDTIFSDLNFAGLNGLRLMEGQLRHEDFLERLNGLMKRYNLPVSGSSYGDRFQYVKAR
jgi:hypothetical protein